VWNTHPVVDQLEKEFLPAIGYALVCNQDREQEPQIAKPECMDDANAGKRLHYYRIPSLYPSKEQALSRTCA